MTTDKNKYKCVNTRWYVNHNDEMNQLFVEDGTVDETRSNLDDVNIKDVSFSSETNVLQYNIYNDAIDIDNDKFVYNDVQYFCVRSGSYPEHFDRVTTIYANEFNLG